MVCSDWAMLLRRGSRRKRSAGYQGQASWVSSVINLVNTSELGDYAVSLVGLF